MAPPARFPEKPTTKSCICFLLNVFCCAKFVATFQIPEATLHRTRMFPDKLVLIGAKTENRTGPENGRWFLQVEATERRAPQNG